MCAVHSTHVSAHGFYILHAITLCLDPISIGGPPSPPALCFEKILDDSASLLIVFQSVPSEDFRISTSSRLEFPGRLCA